MTYVAVIVRVLAESALVDAGFAMVGSEGAGHVEHRRTVVSQVHAQHPDGPVVRFSARLVKRQVSLSAPAEAYVAVRWQVWTTGGWSTFGTRLFNREIDNGEPLIGVQLNAEAKVLFAALQGAAE